MKHWKEPDALLTLIGRFSTIDSILVNLYVKRHFGKNIEIEKLYVFDFIEKYEAATVTHAISVKNTFRSLTSLVKTKLRTSL